MVVVVVAVVEMVVGVELHLLPELIRASGLQHLACDELVVGRAWRLGGGRGQARVRLFQNGVNAKGLVHAEVTAIVGGI